MSAVMICKLEMWPEGTEDSKVELGEVRIVRDGGDQHIAHYKVELAKSAIAKRPGPWRYGRIVNFRRRMMGPYDLLLRALIACIGGRQAAEALAVPQDTVIFDPPTHEREVA